MSDKPYGCFNREAKRTFPVQDGWTYSWTANGMTRMPVIKESVFRNSTDCQYSITTFDVKCQGCIHNVTNLQGAIP